MPARRHLFLYIVICFMPVRTLLAQYTASSINFRNPGPYSPADLRAVANLQPGKSFNKGALGAAAQKLISTGLFDDVQVVLDGPVTAISVNFTLKPYGASQLLAVSFENFVWWQPEQLMAELHERVPLLNPASPALPEAGDQQDAVTAALEAMLAAKGITAHIEHQLVEPSITQPHRAIVYSVASPEMRLHAFSFTGVSPSQQPAVHKLLPILIGHPYLDGSSPRSDTERVLNLTATRDTLTSPSLRCTAP